MTEPGFTYESLSPHPLDVIERMVSAHDWTFQRSGDEEMAVSVPGRWCDFSLFFSWNDMASAMLFTCAFDIRIPPRQKAVVYELLALINEKTWLGHFGVWEAEGLPMFRHSLPLRGSSGPSLEQIEDMVDTAIDECERFYPAFQYVLWAGKTPAEAMIAAMLETKGEA